MTLFALLLALHALAATVWVGGMFFAYLALRPAVAELPPPQRLPLLCGAFRRFFGWVWLALATLLATGYGLVFGVYGGLAGSAPHIHIMQGIGIVMMLLFAHLYFAPFRRLRRAVAARDWPAGGASVAQIRLIVGVNLVLGLIVVATASSGRFW